MATNKSMIKILERLADLIDEANAINKVLRGHIAGQKALGPRERGNDKYVYNEKQKKYTRVKT